MTHCAFVLLVQHATVPGHFSASFALVVAFSKPASHIEKAKIKTKVLCQLPLRKDTQKRMADQYSKDPHNSKYNKTLDNICVKVNNIMASVSLDTFFNLNPILSLRKYPNIESFKHGFVALNERLYKEAKKKQTNQEENGHLESPKLKRNHLLVLEDKAISRKLKYKIGRSAMKYLHSHSIIKLFNGFFSLFEYHHRVFTVHPQIFQQYFSTIFTVFASMEKAKIEKMFREVCNSPRMHEFYVELYNCWEDEVNNAEKEVLLQKR